MKVGIGVPHLGPLPGYWVDSMLSLVRPGGAQFFRVEGKPVDIARNEIVKRFLETDLTHLFFMDSDMVFPPEALLTLAAREKDVISGTYFARTDTPVPHVYLRHHTDENGVVWYRTMAQEFRQWAAKHLQHDTHPMAVVLPAKESLVRCNGTGGGCLLISRRVLERVGATHPGKWFECYETGGGEDFDFCEKAQAHGFEVWADWSVQCGHEAKGSFIAREEFFGCFAEVADLTAPVLVEVGPAGKKRYRQGAINTSIKEKASAVRSA